MLCVYLLGFWGCASKPKASDVAPAKPTMTVQGFSCELGGKKCHDRRVGRQMRDHVIDGVIQWGRFRPMHESESDKKHLADVSDMLWISGESTVLDDLVRVGESDYLLVGRVFGYDDRTKTLSVEMSLIERRTGRKVSAQGHGEEGSLSLAVEDAMRNLQGKLDEFLK